MEAVGLPSLTIFPNSRFNFQKQSLITQFLTKPSHFRSTADSDLYSFSKTRHFRWVSIRMQADNEDYELKQAKDMAAARKRWEALVRDEKVEVLTPREAGYAIQLSNKTLLDVRPSTERKKAWVKSSTWIPIFEVDNRWDADTVSRKVTSFVMGITPHYQKEVTLFCSKDDYFVGGWWSGVPTLSYDSQFLSKVEEKFPKDTDLIVACQKGLRSLAACELLYNAGYRNLFWVQQGLEDAEEEDLVIEGPQPIKFASIGGVSEFLGWTDQQRVQAAKEGWGYRLLYSARLVGVFLVADALFLSAQRVGSYIQDLKSR